MTHTEAHRAPCRSAETARAFAHEWIAAWNAHDLPRILAHYAEDFEMRSPLIVERMGVAEGVLRGKEAVGAYWANGLATQPPLRFELIEVFRGPATLALLYRSVSRNRNVIETLQFGLDGKIVKAAAIYGEPP